MVAKFMPILKLCTRPYPTLNYKVCYSKEMKSLPTKYILYVAFGYFLCSSLYTSLYLGSLSSGSTINELESMRRLSLIALPFYALGLFCTYLRFEKNNLNATWGLTIAGAYLLYPLISSFINIGYALEATRDGRISYDYWLIQLFVYLLTLIPLFVIFQTFLVDKSVLIGTKEKKEYKPSDEISDKDFLPTLILCFFVGMLGIHRFYAGKVGTGIAMIVTLGGLGIWVLVDFILICIGSFRDIDGRIIKYQRVVTVAQNSSMGNAEELEKFAELKDKGVISEEEFNQKKEELLK